MNNCLEIDTGECFACHVPLRWEGDIPETPQEVLCHACEKIQIFEIGCVVGAAIVAWGCSLQEHHNTACPVCWKWKSGSTWHNGEALCNDCYDHLADAMHTTHPYR